MPFSGFTQKSKTFQFALSVLVIVAVSGLCYMVKDLTGYRTVALILLFTVSVLAILVSVYPVLTAAILSALIWDFFFIPPFFTFHINHAEDVLMLVMYFIIALLSGILTSNIRHYEKQVQIKEEKLSTLKLYNTLINSVSHEFRTPMTTIIGISENLIYNGDKISREEQQVLIREVYVATNRLTRLVDNLLDMSRLESGLLQLRYDWCDIHDLIYTVVQRLDKDLGAHPLSIQINEDIPLVKIDRILFEQAVFNILHNASAHTPAGTQVEISAGCTGDHLVIVIRDNGPGFPAGSHDMLFEKFYRAGNKKPGGLGLGLSIARGFIAAHGGEISLHNIISGGAEIRITVPVEKSKIDAIHE